jgi:hypothetical protein
MVFRYANIKKKTNIKEARPTYLMKIPDYYYNCLFSNYKKGPDGERLNILKL